MKISKQQLQKIIAEAIATQLKNTASLKQEDSNDEEDNMDNIFDENHITTDKLTSLITNMFKSKLSEDDEEFVIQYYMDFSNHNDYKLPSIYNRSEIKDEIFAYDWDDIVDIMKYAGHPDNCDSRYDRWWFFYKNRYITSFDSLSSEHNPIDPYKFARMIQAYIEDSDLDTREDDIKFAKLLHYEY